MASPHLTIDTLLPRRISEQASRPVHDLVGMLWVPEQRADGLDDVAELDEVLLAGSVLERDPAFLPLRSLRE